MTPIAHAIAKQATLQAEKRKPVYVAEAHARTDAATFISDVHCFECTEVIDLAFELADSGRLSEVLDDRIFLPAPRTWIEHRDESGRIGWLLTEHPFRFQMVVDQGHRFFVKELKLTDSDTESLTMCGLVLAMLALINAPHIVGRQEMPPHRGLERLWAKQFSKFPLHAWHELKLRIAKPIEIEDDEPHAAHIGGRRAFHFCRAHLRIRLGRLEFVTSHWRGDEQFGTKLTRYRMAK